MNSLFLTTTFVLVLNAVFGQPPTNISGSVVDENGNPVSNAIIRFHSDDSAYTDKQGKFKVAYPNPQSFWYRFYIEKEGFLPKRFYVDLSNKEVKMKESIVIRSRKGFWYNANDIDSSHVGMKVKDVIIKYKLNFDECLFWDEPPGVYRNFEAELGDSSYIRITFERFFVSRKPLNKNEVLEKVVRGIGIGYTNGTSKVFGNGWAEENPYFTKRKRGNGN